MVYVSTGSKVLDTVFPNGFPSGCISAVFSLYDTGKTFLMTQTACHLWKEKKEPTLYIDTEGYFWQEDVRKRLWSYFQKRWNFTDEPQIHYEFPHTLYDLFKLVGKGLKLITDEKKQMVTPHIWNITEFNASPLYELVEDKGFKLLILDSLTLPVKEEIQTPPRQNFPCRAAVEAAIAGRLNPIARDFNIPVVITMHGSKDPTNPYDTGKPAGSSSLRYYVKHILQLRGDPKKEKRIAVRFRYPGLTSERTKEEGEEVTLAKDIGFTP
jgi:predicted ATP-dependent serine protease